MFSDVIFLFEDLMSILLSPGQVTGLSQVESVYQGKNWSTEHSKGNKTVLEKVATTRTEDGQKQTAKTRTEIQNRKKMEHWTTEEEMEGPTPL